LGFGGEALLFAVVQDVSVGVEDGEDDPEVSGHPDQVPDRDGAAVQRGRPTHSPLQVLQLRGDDELPGQAMPGGERTVDTGPCPVAERVERVVVALPGGAGVGAVRGGLGVGER
jgi:hypothetical protein